MDSARIVEELGWKPDYTFDKGLEEYLQTVEVPSSSEKVFTFRTLVRRILKK